ncbi:MAG: hypothetical protein PHC68_05270 [Syntrophorhabdaceae bacterium]|jgi:hypothetical protein|nr:hypothetical protein [Syntrophorhabdaceae bacterium]
MATKKTFTAKANTSFFLNIEPRIISSGMLAPALQLSPQDPEERSRK